MEDDNSMSDRILCTLETILINDPQLKEFSIIPADSNTKNKSPILYEEHNIGLESWCIKHIYKYAYLELFESRKLLTKQKLSFAKERDLNRLLIGALLINPDVSTFWNMKRELVSEDILSANSELFFAKIVLSYKSKSNEAFAYRKWLLNRILAKGDTQTVQNLLDNEMTVCEMAAAKSPNNYHAWTHRIWCLDTMADKVGNFSDRIFQELEFSRKWVSEHVSEHTGYHYRQYLFNCVRRSKFVNNIFEFYYGEVLKIFNLVNENDPRDILVSLLGKEKRGKATEAINIVNFVCLLLFDLHNTVEVLNSVYPNHEALWYHRRYLLYGLVKTAHEYHSLAFKMNGQFLYGTNILKWNDFADLGETQAKLFKPQPNKVESSLLYQSLVKSESEFIKKNKTQSTFYNLEMAKRHEEWLKFIICIDNV